MIINFAPNSLAMRTSVSTSKTRDASERRAKMADASYTANDTVAARDGVGSC
jgi:hypothetical protein